MNTHHSHVQRTYPPAASPLYGSAASPSLPPPSTAHGPVPQQGMPPAPLPHAASSAASPQPHSHHSHPHSHSLGHSQHQHQQHQQHLGPHQTHSHHHVLHGQPPPPPQSSLAPPSQSSSHHHQSLSQMPPPPPHQANGIPPPPPLGAGGPSPRVVPGVSHALADGPMSVHPPPPRSASASSLGHSHHISHHHHQHQHASQQQQQHQQQQQQHVHHQQQQQQHNHHPLHSQQSQSQQQQPPVQHNHLPHHLGLDVGNASMSTMQKLAHANEQTWISIGSAAEAMEDFERAIAAYESALRHNPYSMPAMNAIAGVHRTMDRFEKAVEYFKRVLNIVPENGEIWGAMGHCYLMMDELQNAYMAYQQALYHLPNPKEPKLWYGIGILYDRYGSLEHAEEAFASVVRMDPNYEKSNEIYFRLGIIYKQQQKFQASLDCFRFILNNPPRPLTEIDIWFQIGHVQEHQHEYGAAKEAYERVLADNPNHAKVLQQLGWLYHTSDAGFENQDRAIQLLTKSLEIDPNDAQSWYLLGRAYMFDQNYSKAYEAYQQAVYRDGKNPTFWCSIGVLYYQINQYRDALDAYSRAIRINPYISEVWYDLGSLYESCNNQLSDAIDAYARAAELDPDNARIQQRISMLRNAEATGEAIPSAPSPLDVHPTAYANQQNGMVTGPPSSAVGGAAGGSGPAPSSAAVNGGPSGEGPGLTGGLGAFGVDPNGNHSGPSLHAVEGGSLRDLPGPPQASIQSRRRDSQSPSGGGPGGRERDPVIPNIDERGTKPSTHTQLGPMQHGSRGPSPPPPQHQLHGGAYGHYERTSPRAQAYGGGPSSRAQYANEREREMEWERGRRERDLPSHHSRGDSDPQYNNGRQYERLGGESEHGGETGYAQPGRDLSHRHQTNAPSSQFEEISEVDATVSKGFVSSGPRKATGPGRPSSAASRKGIKDEGLLVENTSSPRRKAGQAVPRGGNSTPRGTSPARGSVRGTPSSSASRTGGPASGKSRKTKATTPSAESPAANVSQMVSAVSPAASDTSSASNQPLAASTTTAMSSSQGAAPSRIVDEDYDDGAADALMGLAGAAAATAPSSSQHEKDEADFPPKGGAEEKSKKENDKKKEAEAATRTDLRSVSDETATEANAEKTAEVRARAEAAAAAEDQDAKSGAIQSMLGRKRAAEEKEEADAVAQEGSQKPPQEQEVDRPSSTKRLRGEEEDNERNRSGKETEVSEAQQGPLVAEIGAAATGPSSRDVEMTEANGVEKASLEPKPFEQEEVKPRAEYSDALEKAGREDNGGAMGAQPGAESERSKDNSAVITESQRKSQETERGKGEKGAEESLTRRASLQGSADRDGVDRERETASSENESEPEEGEVS